ncbi:MAG: 4-hydroxy-tetrahydrodipicolinate reductase [Pseudomonadota bacterium]
MIGVGVVGAAGRMGRTLVAAVVEAEDMTLVAASEREGSPAIGADAGLLAGIGTTGTRIAPSDFAEADVVIDFTTPATSVATAEALAPGKALVVGTTGFCADDDARFGALARERAIVKSGNMSLGINLLARLVRQAAAALPGADLEVLEMHHRRKVDAPSGTALMLGHAAADGRGVALDKTAVYAREGQTGARPAGTIGFANLRGGTVIGEHEVILALDGERVRLGHIAENRSLFANGAVVAARWVAGRAPGLYSMDDVLAG